MTLINSQNKNRREISLVYISTVMISLIIIAMVTYGLVVGTRLSEKYPSLVDAVMEAKLETTKAHLWFEEIISGDHNEDISTVWKHLDTADGYLKFILENEKSAEERLDVLERRLESTGVAKPRAKLSQFREITEKRYAAKSVSGIGSEVDQLYDHIFQEIGAELEIVENNIQELMTKDIKHFRTIQTFVISACIILSLLNLFIFRRFQRRQSQNLLSLAETKNQLENQMAARLQSEEELKSSERKYRQLFDFMINGMALHEIITDDHDQPIDYRYLEINRPFQDLTGIDAKTTIGKTVKEVIPWIEEDQFDWISAYGKVALLGEELRMEQYAEPLNRWYNINAYSPRKGYFATIIEEITDRKKMEIALKETNASLEDLIYVTSHDLQTPLVSLEGYASELLNDYKDQLDENGVYCLTRLKNNAERMHQLILNLLDISRLNTQKYPYESFDPNQSIEEIKKDLSLAIEKAQANVSSAQLPKLHGDKNRLEGVFRKLISNSISYGAKNIEIRYENNTYQVKDDGAGIPADQLEKIFKPGERLKLVDVEGSGMGLTFCRKVISQHEGKIWAASEGLGKGSVFSFYIRSENR